MGRQALLLGSDQPASNSAFDSGVRPPSRPPRPGASVCRIGDRQSSHSAGDDLVADQEAMAHQEKEFRPSGTLERPAHLRTPRDRGRDGGCWQRESRPSSVR
jgi:hypothetical protein